MTAKEINEKALDFLSNQDWKNAQFLFFDNVRKNPCHQTYNNLGVYLINEGLECKNGKTRNAFKLGFKYLLKAAEIKISTINTYAIVEAINSLLLQECDKKNLYQFACDCLKKALVLDFSYELQFDYLRFLYLLDPQNKELLNKANSLVQKFPCSESVSLYFQLLRINYLMDEALSCIEHYGSFIDEVDLFIFYAEFELYEQGYSLCNYIHSSYSMNDFIASAIIECCINTNHISEAQNYATRIQDNYDGINYQVFENLTNKSLYRQKKIKSYFSYLPTITTCCYFGCKKHNNEWD